MWIFFKAVEGFYQYLSLEERLSAGSGPDSRAWRVSVGTPPKYPGMGMPQTGSGTATAATG